MNLSTEKIYNEFYSKLRLFILKRVPDKDITNDILQNVFIKIHSNIYALKDDSKLQSWIYQITRNAIIDHFRKNKNNVDIDELISLADETEEESAEKRLSRSIRCMINSLPKKYKTALIYTEFLNLTQNEAAEKLGISLGAFKSRVQRGRGKLKEMFLECCHLEFDRLGKVIDYHPNCKSCSC
jgi:RNA polymerase sigma-70 factor (ECF subfamily)